MNWTDTIYSDGTRRFVSNPHPKMHETVRVRLCAAADAPLEMVYLRIIRNGEPRTFQMQRCRKEAGFIWYETGFEVTQKRMQYQFYLIAEGKLYYYTQRGLSDYATDRKHDFVLLTDYVQPEWVKHAVFYQIFPERFYNGDPSNDVRDGEYQVNGYDTMKIRDWNTPAGTYDQVHCADFYGGDLQGIMQKIPYLKDLGVTAVYLNPIFLAPSVHKYDCIDYMHVDPHFGGDQALADLSAALHGNGMKLILDISINHTGTAHKWFNRDCLYFDRSVGAYHNPDSPERAYYMIHEDGSYECWDNVPELPKLDFASGQLRRALYQAEDSVLKKWLKEPYAIDGWRFDVADCMANFNEQQLAGEVWPQIRSAIRQTSDQAYILAENWDDCTEYLQGDCWDAPMNYYGFGRLIRQFYGAPDPYMERDPQLTAASRQLSAENFRARVEEYLSRIPFALQQNQFNLFDSHDTGRFHIYKGITEEKYRGALIAQFTMIGTPSIYYGDEASIGGRTGFFEGGRYPMPWDSGFEKTDRFALHQLLAHLRQEHPVFAEGSMKFLYAKKRILAFSRFDEQECFITVISSSEKEEEIFLPVIWPGRAIGVEPVDGQITDVTGRNCICRQISGHEISLVIPAEGAFLFCLGGEIPQR